MEYSFSKNCIEIKIDGGNEKFSVNKLYLQVPIKHLYYDMIKPLCLRSFDEALDSGEHLIISDSKLCELLPPQVKLISKQRRDLCGCEFLF